MPVLVILQEKRIDSNSKTFVVVVVVIFDDLGSWRIYLVNINYNLIKNICEIFLDHCCLWYWRIECLKKKCRSHTYQQRLFGLGSLEIILATKKNLITSRRLKRLRSRLHRQYRFSTCIFFYLILPNNFLFFTIIIIIIIMRWGMLVCCVCIPPMSAKTTTSTTTLSLLSISSE